MHRSEIDQVLSRHLAGTQAPGELWHRIQRASAANTPRPSLQLRWALVTALVILAAVSAARVAGEGWRPGAERIEFRSMEAIAIREWIRSTTGLDVPLPEQALGPVRLVCAVARKGRKPTAEISYRAGNQSAVLLVSAASTTARDAHHHFLHRSDRISSWTMQGQTYTLSCRSPGDCQIACSLCHEAALN